MTSAGTTALAMFATATKAISDLEDTLNSYVPEFASFYLEDINMPAFTSTWTPHLSAFNDRKWTMVTSMCTNQFFRLKKGKDILELPVAFIDDPEAWKDEKRNQMAAAYTVVRDAASRLGTPLAQDETFNIYQRRIAGRLYYHASRRRFYVDALNGDIYKISDSYGNCRFEEELSAGLLTPIQ